MWTCAILRSSSYRRSAETNSCWALFVCARFGPVVHAGPLFFEARAVARADRGARCASYIASTCRARGTDELALAGLKARDIDLRAGRIYLA